MHSDCKANFNLPIVKILFFTKYERAPHPLPMVSSKLYHIPLVFTRIKAKNAPNTILLCVP